MKKAIAKCSHEDAPELSLPPYRSSYRFVNTMINKGDNYENINDMATMFAKMMHEMKNRNSFGTVKLGEVKMFTKCCEKAKTKLCMHQDIKKKVESNFGPMEDIL